MKIQLAASLKIVEVSLVFRRNSIASSAKSCEKVSETRDTDLEKPNISQKKLTFSIFPDLFIQEKCSFCSFYLSSRDQKIVFLYLIQLDFIW